ncbi:DNA-directed RNA polymerase subunit 6 [Indivirus ILV1]|uniref:DNA-directed RNA polymerase subunit 6 n=1 Tax=Indivirus ILV1 TaxID=1977633 RepID=A0A1V0SCP8_9VIRU|nr:DNA-directed RNA polymerase subunit 6 [Indivirus ILV1]
MKKSKSTSKKVNKKVTIIDETNDKPIKENKKDVTVEKDENEEKETDADPVIEEEEYDDSFGDNDNEVEDEDKEIENEDEDEEPDEGEEGDVGEGEEREEEKGKDTCIYNYAENNSDEEEQELVFDDDNIVIQSEIVPKEKRITKPILYKYERVRLLGDRTQQLTLGAKPMIKNIEGLTMKQIAEVEIQENVIPLIIQRPLPNGKKERWYINELKH